MFTTRRSFIKQTAGAAGAMMLPGFLSASRKEKGLVGVQLYSVRDEMK